MYSFVRKRIPGPTVGNPSQAEQVLVTGAAGGVSIGRAALKNPNWPAVAAAELGVARDQVPFAAQYWPAHW